MGPISVASSGTASPSTCGVDDAFSESGSTVSGSSYTGSQSGVASSRGYGGDDEFYESDSTVRGFSYHQRQSRCASSRGYGGDDERSESDITLCGADPAWHTTRVPEDNAWSSESESGSTQLEGEPISVEDGLACIKFGVIAMDVQLAALEKSGITGIEHFVYEMGVQIKMMDGVLKGVDAFKGCEAPRQRWTGIVASNRSFDGALR